MANLARELPESRSTILEHGGIPKLLALLTSKSITTKEYAVSAIAQIANQNTKAQRCARGARGKGRVCTASRNVAAAAAFRAAALFKRVVRPRSDGRARCAPPLAV